MAAVCQYPAMFHQPRRLGGVQVSAPRERQEAVLRSREILPRSRARNLGHPLDFRQAPFTLVSRPDAGVQRLGFLAYR